MFKFQGAFKIAIALVIAFILLVITSLSYNGYNFDDIKRPFRLSLSVPPETSPDPPPRRNVAVATTFGPHMTVYMPIAGTFEKILNRTDSVRLYSHPLDYNYWDIVHDLDLFHSKRRDIEEFLVDVNSTISDEGDMIDIIVLGTCNFDLDEWGKDLLEIWELRPPDHKFQIVCMVHYVNGDQWIYPMTEWVRRGAIRLLTIAEHVVRGARRALDAMADSKDPLIRLSGFEYVKIDPYIPILDLPIPARNRSTSSRLSNAVVQGLFDINSRDYLGIFDDLIISLQKDPAAWGYLPLSSPDAAYEPDPSQSEPFILHLAGNEFNRPFTAPHVLTNVVRFHLHLDFRDFYKLMESMDVLVPAWLLSGYYDSNGSSAVFLAVQCNLPLLATQRIRSAYTYLANDINDNRVTITRPQFMRKMEAIKALRTGHYEDLHNVTKEERAHVERFLVQGWKRSMEDFSAVKEEIWRRNEEVVRSVLSDGL